jgi:hypothetical protein
VAAEAVKSLKDNEVDSIFEANPYLEEKILYRNSSTL